MVTSHHSIEETYQSLHAVPVYSLVGQDSGEQLGTQVGMQLAVCTERPLLVLGRLMLGPGGHEGSLLGVKMG